MAIIKIDKDEVNKLLKKAKDKATDVIGEENMNVLSDIGKTVSDAGFEIKETIKENYDDQIKHNNKANNEIDSNVNSNVDKPSKKILTEEEKLEKKRNAEERKLKKQEQERLKLEKEKKIAEEKKIKRQEFIKKYKVLIIIASCLVVIGIVAAIIGSSLANKGKIEIGYNSSDLKNSNYQEVVNNLKSKGFKNIKLEEKPDLIIGLLNSEGDVESISINGSDTFYSSSKFYPNDMITITYHTFPKQEETEGTETNENNEIVNEQTNNENNTSEVITGHFTKNGIPMVECSLDQVTDVCYKHNVTNVSYDDADMYDGTMFKDIQKDNYGLSTTIVYDKETKEVVSVSVVPMAVDSHEDQISFIMDLAEICCSSTHSEEVKSWFNDNLGNDTETTIDGIVYRTNVGKCDNYCVSFGEGNWEDWVD